MHQSLTLAGPEDTEALGARLAAALPDDASGWTLLLQGELGAGKSTLARAMLRSLGHEGSVPSPTYTLVEPYALSRFTAYHVDLYRIESVEELEFLGWSDLGEGLLLVEWPERVPDLAGDLRIRLALDGNGRRADLEPLSERGQALLDDMT